MKDKKLRKSLQRQGYLSFNPPCGSGYQANSVRKLEYELHALERYLGVRCTTTPERTEIVKIKEEEK